MDQANSSLCRPERISDHGPKLVEGHNKTILFGDEACALDRTRLLKGMVRDAVQCEPVSDRKSLFFRESRGRFPKIVLRLRQFR